MEFGLLNGESVIDAVHQLKSGLKKVYGFDSFEGLPPLSQLDQVSAHFTPSFRTGNYKGLSEPDVRKNIELSSRIHTSDLILTPGFFDVSLPEFDKNQLLDSGFPLLFYLDCDLYSSTIDVLFSLEDQITSGTVIVFDEWYYNHKDIESNRQHEQKAFFEWAKAKNIRYQILPELEDERRIVLII